MNIGKTALISLLLICLAVPAIADVWEKTVIDSTGTSTGVNCAIAIDSHGLPHISYADLDNFYLYYAHYNGSSWSIQSVDSFGIAGLHTSIALDENDYPHISYTAHGFNLRYVYWNGGAWHNEIVDSGIINSGMQGFRTSLKIDKLGDPHIAYANDTSGAIKYAHYDGDSWNTVELQDIVETFYINLVLKDDSIPYIGYHALDNSSMVDTLRVAYWSVTESAWQFETMTNQTCPTGIYFQSFDMDSEGNCYFAYQPVGMVPGMPCTADFSPSRTIAKFDGSSWSYESVPNPPGGQYDIFLTFPLFLKMDNNDNPAFLADTYLYWKRDGVNWSYYDLGNQMGDEVAVFQQLVFDEYNFPNMVFGQPWTVYYKLYPGDPQIVVPFRSNTYSENYESWNCLIQSDGEAPVIIDSLKFTAGGSAFEVVNDDTPLYIYGGESDSLTIRFTPSDAITYHDTLLIYSNDSSDLLIEIALEGTGSFDPDKGEMVVYVKDCYAAPEYFAINKDNNLTGVNVSLYQGGVLQYGPVASDFNGLALQSNIDPGDYELRLQKDVELPRDDGTSIETLRHAFNVTIDTGLNVEVAIFPESLMVQSYQWVYDLSNIQVGGVKYVYPAEAISSNNVRNMLDSWLPDLDSMKIESAARMILAQNMFNELFTPERHLGEKGLEGISDMVHFIIKATDTWDGLGWIGKLIKVVKIIAELYAGDKAAALMELMQLLMEYIVIEIVDEIVDRVGDELPCVLDPFSEAELVCGDRIIKAAWKDIKNTYSIWDLPNFGDDNGPENSWNACKELVFETAQASFVQGVYVNILTNPILDDARQKSSNFNFSSDFTTAAEQSLSDLGRIKVIADDVNFYSGQLLFQADLLNKTIVVISALSNFLPLPSWMETVKTACMYAAIGSAATASGIAFSGFFAIPVEMDQNIDKIYNPSKKFSQGLYADAALPTAEVNAVMLNSLKQKIQKAADDYDSVLTAVQGNILSHEIEDAFFSVGDLALADINLMNTVSMSTAPAYAVAHALYDSMPGFSGLYDGIITNSADAGMTRFFGYMSLIQLPGDSSEAMKTYIYDHLDTARINNQVWTDGALELLDSLFGLEIPAIVVASEASQDQYGLGVDDTGTIAIRLQNVGALAADSIYIKFETNPGLYFIETDSVYIGSLGVGEESGLYKWTVVVNDTSYQAAFWTANVYSSNAKNYSPDGSLKIKIATPVDVHGNESGNTLPNNFALNQNYPNPFNPSTEISFEVPYKTDVKVEVFNILGRKIETLADDEFSAGRYTVTWDASDFATGLYFYKISTDEFTASKKMIFLK